MVPTTRCCWPGYVPTPEQLDLAGLDAPAADVAAALEADVEEWKAEVPLIEEWFDKVGRSCPHRCATNSRSSSCAWACRSRWPAGLIVHCFEEVRPMILHIRIAAGATPPTGHVASYWCAKGHHTPRRWSTDVTAPELWECSCGLPAGRARAHPPSRGPGARSGARWPICWNDAPRPNARRCWTRPCSAFEFAAAGATRPPHTWNRGHDRAQGALEHVDGPDSGSRRTPRCHRR